MTKKSPLIQVFLPRAYRWQLKHGKFGNQVVMMLWLHMLIVISGCSETLLCLQASLGSLRLCSSACGSYWKQSAVQSFRMLTNSDRTRGKFPCKKCISGMLIQDCFWSVDWGLYQEYDGQRSSLDCSWRPLHKVELLGGAIVQYHSGGVKRKLVFLSASWPKEASKRGTKMWSRPTIGLPPGSAWRTSTRTPWRGCPGWWIQSCTLRRLWTRWNFHLKINDPVIGGEERQHPKWKEGWIELSKLFAFSKWSTRPKYMLESETDQILFPNI